MPKRRASEDEDGSEYSAASAGSDNDTYVADKRTLKKQRKTATGGTAARRAPTAKASASAASSSTQALVHASTTHVLSDEDAEGAANALLDWFAGVYDARGMPWRKRFDPSWTAEQRGQRAYEVWVSEIMLQQTQVATVIPYYNRWMDKFPTLKDLASASIDEVHALWKGLGYYSRASRLLEGAQKVVNITKLKGCLPTNAEAMQAEVPGVGRYSAGAICSIAYGEHVPVLDGNVHRLMSRILAVHANPKAKGTLDLLWAGATALVMAPAAATKAGDLNQALIELGSTICKPKSPACGACPIRTRCRAYALQASSAKPSVLDLMKRSAPIKKADSESKLADVPDIEELCTLCAPIAGAPTVESFPMRAERKKAREETDVVRVVEWRPHAASQERFFILVRRPDGGLLGGLDEFPTEAVDEDEEDVSEADGALTSIQKLLLDTIAPMPPARLSSRHVADADEVKLLRMTRIEEAKDVLHIFSHIRKTYRVRWVLLEGGGDAPPQLRPRPTAAVKGGSAGKIGKSTKKPAKKAKSSADAIDVDAADEKTDVPPTAAATKGIRWVPMNEVSDANIGTGVVKVWNNVINLSAFKARTV